jgi:hypothetical protein
LFSFVEIIYFFELCAAVQPQKKMDWWRGRLPILYVTSKDKFDNACLQLPVASQSDDYAIIITCEQRDKRRKVENFIYKGTPLLFALLPLAPANSPRFLSVENESNTDHVLQVLGNVEYYSLIRDLQERESEEASWCQYFKCVTSPALVQCEFCRDKFCSAECRVLSCGGETGECLVHFTPIVNIAQLPSLDMI